jgi:hypothetical protein
MSARLSDLISRKIEVPHWTPSMLWATVMTAAAVGVTSQTARVLPAADHSSTPPSPPPSTCGEGCKRWVFPDAVETHQARCLDGSPPGFYHRPGRGNATNNYLVYSHGGSWCYDLNASDTSATWNCLVCRTLNPLHAVCQAGMVIFAACTPFRPLAS